MMKEQDWETTELRNQLKMKDDEIAELRKEMKSRDDHEKAMERLSEKIEKMCKQADVINQLLLKNLPLQPPAPSRANTDDNAAESSANIATDTNCLSNASPPQPAGLPQPPTLLESPTLPQPSTLLETQPSESTPPTSPPDLGDDRQLGLASTPRQQPMPTKSHDESQADGEHWVKIDQTKMPDATSVKKLSDMPEEEVDAMKEEEDEL